jgi:hypothetical protein
LVVDEETEEEKEEEGDAGVEELRTGPLTP